MRRAQLQVPSRWGVWVGGWGGGGGVELARVQNNNSESRIGYGNINIVININTNMNVNGDTHTSSSIHMCVHMYDTYIHNILVFVFGIFLAVLSQVSGGIFVGDIWVVWGRGRGALPPKPELLISY